MIASGPPAGETGDDPVLVRYLPFDLSQTVLHEEDLLEYTFSG